MPNYNDLINTIQSAVDGFNKSIPSIQKGVLDEVLAQIKNFDLDKNRKVINSVKNIRLLNSIKNRLNRVILTDDYKDAVREYAKVFNEVSRFQRDYFRTVEKDFRPPPVVEEIKRQTVDDVLSRLTESGIAANVSDRISNLLKRNITTGVSYAELAEQLREQIKKTDTPGILERHVKQVVTDSVNQYSAQYMNTVSGDLGYEWFKYQGKDIITTRPFCDAMTDREYFHISEVPNLLKANGLYYVDDEGNTVKVPIYKRTGLPHGMIEGTTVENFFVNRGGYNCGHQIFPVPESRVPQKISSRVKESGEYLAYKGTPIYDSAKQKKAINENRAENGEDATSITLHQKSTGELKVERQALHDKIHKKITGDIVPKERPIAQIVGGAPANGKSTYVESGKNRGLPDATHVDPDGIKMEFHEYRYLLDKRDEKAAAYIHDESSMLGDRVISTVTAKKGNITVDRLMTSVKAVKKLTTQLRAAGYRSEMNYTTLDTDLSLKLADIRGKKTGRFVPESIVRAKNKELAENFDDILEGNYFDSLNLWDTNTEGQPKLILSQKDGEVKVHDRELYNRFLKKGGKTSRY